MEETKPTKLHELFARPGTWTQGVFACDADGNDVNPSNAKACQWCLMSAVLRIYSGEGQDDYIPVRDKLRERLLGSDGIVAFNDRADRTQEEVYALCAELDV